MKYVLATGNKNKVKEIKEILNGKADVVTMKELGIDVDVEETGTTFAENSLIKARAICSLTGLPAIADDSGLEVDYLNGAPGVYSARFAGLEHDDEANRQKLLRELSGVPDEKRTAHFVTVISVCYPDGNFIQTEGKTYGKITHEYRGEGGFGYDCLFLSDDLGVTFGEATPEQKNSVSHRSRALKELAKRI
ncbi:MAG: XTP/dITP diphosphatase [Clostridia bacterium]|nr:XTP/dITP diphosphatase [Clostridia bacterium]